MHITFNNFQRVFQFHIYNVHLNTDNFNNEIVQFELKKRKKKIEASIEEEDLNIALSSVEIY